MKLLTSAEVRAILRCSRSGLYSKRCQGLPWIKSGGRILFLESDIEAWIMQHRQAPKENPARGRRIWEESSPDPQPRMGRNGRPRGRLIPRSELQAGDKLVTRQEAAKLLGYSLGQLSGRCANGSLRYVKQGHRIFFRPVDLKTHTDGMISPGMKQPDLATEHWLDSLSKKMKAEERRSSSRPPLMSSESLRPLDQRTKTLPMRPSGDFLTNQEAASLLGYSLGVLARRRAKGLISFTRHGQRVFFRAIDLKAYMNRRNKSAN